MSAATSAFFRAVSGAAAGLVSKAGDKASMRGFAFALLAAAAVAPVNDAMAQQFGTNSEAAMVHSAAPQQASAPVSAVGSNEPGVVNGVKQIGTGLGSIVTGVGRFISGASGNVAATIGNIGAPASVGANPVAMGQLSPAQQEAYDKLAVGAAAQRLVAEAAFDSFASKSEAAVLSPRNASVAREVLSARNSLNREVAALNIAVAEFGNATNVLSRRYKETNFNAYKALQASISSPIELRAGEVTQDKPIYPQAEELAVQIMAGEVPRATSVSAGRNAVPGVAAVGGNANRLAYRSQ